MPTYRVNETQLAYVTWLYDVEAESEEDARLAVVEGQCEPQVLGRGHSIGDSYSMGDSEYQVDKIDTDPAKSIHIYPPA